MRAVLSLLSTSMLALPAFAADVNLRVIVSSDLQPGNYGIVDFGSARPPPVLYERPVVALKKAERVPPLYLHVPPGHAKNWSKHCHKYGACARPVYFVKSEEYEPGYKPKKEKKDKKD